jgi:thiosulfate/3-mercaptopyruvate sulfurtransferase
VPSAGPGAVSPDARPDPDPGPLIGVADLAARLGSHRPPALLDVRWRLGGPPGFESYLAGHLPGACFVDLDQDLAGPPGSGAGGRHPLPSAGSFEAAMRRAGLRIGQVAVVYDDGDSTVAARMWWLLRYFGHHQVAVLDGGLRAWTAANLPVTTDVPRPDPGDFAAGVAGGMPVLDDHGAARLARSGFLLDARAAERYRGEVEPVDPAAGHIPGAISAPAAGNVRPDGVFLRPHELARRFAGLGLPAAADLATTPAASPSGAARIGAYCGSGVTAAQEVLALELAGLPAALYVGSWSAWSADPSRPVATGPEPG